MQTLLLGWVIKLLGFAAQPCELRRMASSRKHTNRPVIAALVLTFLPCQPCRSLSLSGGSAAKVFESRSQKSKSKQQKRGEFFAARTTGPNFGVSGMLGSPFLGLLSFGEAKESN